MHDQQLLTILEDATPVNVNVEGSEAVEVEWKDGQAHNTPTIGC